jgi:predicted nucleotidyltransferase component of viral defense system
MKFNLESRLYEVVNLLKKSNIPLEAWSFGGGTALMFLYQHRYSKDIDIFFSNPQYLLYLSPRLNDDVLELTTKYEEQSNFIKLFLEDFEIDFIVAGNLTGLEPQLKKIGQMKVYIEHPIEIIAKKIFYRSYSYKVRDIIDFVEVYKRESKLMEYLEKNKLIQDKESLQISIDRIEKSNIEKVLKDLPLDKDITKKEFENYLKVFKKVLNLK